MQTGALSTIKSKKWWGEVLNITPMTHLNTLQVQTVGPAFGSLTYFIHGGVEREEALFEQLVHGLLVLCLDLRHHVAGNKPRPAADLPTVKPVRVLIAVHLGTAASQSARGKLQSANEELGISLLFQLKSYQFRLLI